MNHLHLIYTPRNLADLKPNVVGSSRYCASLEGVGEKRHYHIYLQTDDDESTIRDRIKRIQEIPTGGRGKKSLHYSLRPVAPTDPEYPDRDLQKFTLGYTLKEQTLESIIFRAGYTDEELLEAQAYYRDGNAAARIRAEALVVNEVEIAQQVKRDTILDEWIDYSIFIEKALKRVSVSDQVPVTITWLRSTARKYWRQKNQGLFPQASKSKRFLASIIDQFRSRIDVQERYDEMKNLGY